MGCIVPSRRCGWLDLVALKRSMQINSISGLCLTKLDVLDGLDSVKMCVGYKCRKNGKLTAPPASAYQFDTIEPEYIEMPGWKQTTVGAKKMEDLPKTARAYIERIENELNAPVDIVSTGPDRVETIIKRHPFEV